MSTNLGAAVLKRLTTARLYWQPSGQSGWTDFGNCTSYKDDPKIERVQHMQSKKGFRRLDFELFKQVGTKKTFTFDEHFTAMLMLIYLSNTFPQFNQAGPVGLTADNSQKTADDSQDTADEGGATVNLNPVVFHGVYNLGYQGVMDVFVTDANGAVLIAGLDFFIDGAAGMLTCLQPAPAGPWVVEFSWVPVTDNVFNTFGNLLATGSFKLVEFDQFSAVPINIETFSGQVYVTGWGENKADAFNEYTVEVLHQNSLRLARAD